MMLKRNWFLGFFVCGKMQVFRRFCENLNSFFYCSDPLVLTFGGFYG